METPPAHHAPSFEVIATSSSSHRPDAKTQRYDRQLRLWAASGQAALESCHVLVVNGTATATSILKNLVLPGVGHFTVLDNAKVDQADLGNNFFLEPGTSKVGDNRAEEVIKFLGELNDGVEKNALVTRVSDFLDSSKDPLGPYSLVISVDAPPEDTLSLSDRCWDAGVPFIAVRSCGFIGSVKTQMQEAYFIETHPDAEATIDLRLDVPFPALLEHAKSIDLDALDSHEYAHVPPVVILLQALESWKASHGGSIPKNYSEKNLFKGLINTMKRGGKGADEENFDEAVGMVMKSVKPTKIPDYIDALFKDDKCENITSASPPFWVLLRAVRNFVEDSQINSGAALLPLSGSLPDMKATSAGYASLQSIYKNKAREDLASVTKLVDDICLQVGLDNVNGKVINSEMVAVFVKNCPFVKLVRGTRMREEYERPMVKEIASALQQTDLPDPFSIAGEDSEEERPKLVHPVHFYLALRASDSFYIEHSRWPGSFSNEDELSEDDDLDKLQELVESDLQALKEIYLKVKSKCLGELQEDIGEAEEKALSEITRAGASDLPQIAAFLGGIVAQEAIKIITKQYIPLNGTVVYDAIRSISQTFAF